MISFRFREFDRSEFLNISPVALGRAHSLAGRDQRAEVGEVRRRRLIVLILQVAGRLIVRDRDVSAHVTDSANVAGGDASIWKAFYFIIIPLSRNA